ncbi:hypothetical protein BKK79_27110 [Cupriavidus sp. USMAA2-4]|uniref:GNAT family N-acetyltransferase n=1 Tax=Cupriavidus sp. USMAA2-4 TaxID=876364 RepID=UPI0008A685D2|nr:GNAT family N-acetyltransferase [Cupriavidus sp. USMAA2-4]AOY95438.1 hypothetical protein BKK79_27110 [Cupriavidus sp. USMAA2-4]
MTLTLHPLLPDSASDAAQVWRIFSEAPSYSQRVEGRPPAHADVEDFFHGMPAGKEASDKFLIGLHAGTEMVGCADVIRAYPARDCAFIGLLLVSEAHQGRGCGRTALGLIEAMARGWDCTRLRLAVISTNPRAFAFWQREGFGIVDRRSIPRFTGDVIVMERAIR